jgi:hypothetical protein
MRVSSLRDSAPSIMSTRHFRARAFTCRAFGTGAGWFRLHGFYLLGSSPYVSSFGTAQSASVTGITSGLSRFKMGSARQTLWRAFRIAENGGSAVKSRFALQDLNDSGAAVQWHNNVISAARSRKRETASATRITSPSGAGTLICVRCTPKWLVRESGSASARPACAAVKSLKRNELIHRGHRSRAGLLRGGSGCVSVTANLRR